MCNLKLSLLKETQGVCGGADDNTWKLIVGEGPKSVYVYIDCNVV